MPKSCGKYPRTARSAFGFATMSTSFHVARPSVGRVIVASIRIKVDLPAPLGPSKPSTPGDNSSEKSSKPRTPPR